MPSHDAGEVDGTVTYTSVCRYLCQARMAYAYAMWWAALKASEMTG